MFRLPTDAELDELPLIIIPVTGGNVNVTMFAKEGEPPMMSDEVAEALLLVSKAIRRHGIPKGWVTASAKTYNQ